MAFALAACSDVSYCVQCVRGQIDLMVRARPIGEVLRDAQVPEAERRQLAKVLEIRDFAVAALGLPDNDSYRIYADLQRPYVVWNVVAAPEFSLVAKQWCFPVVGCVAYRGYFDPDKAREMGASLAAEGYDIDVYGVKAYSTLNWFNDPVLNTFLDGSDSQLASLIFHELAHQVAYTADDCSFNEAFAKTVEMEGLRRWLQAHADDAQWQDYLDRERRSKEFLALLEAARGRLVDLYAQPLPDHDKRAGKAAILADAERQLRELGSRWPDPGAMERWLEQGLNNARLASIATYQDRVPAFQALLRAHGDHLPEFYAEVKRLAKLPSAERLDRLNQLEQVEKAAAGLEPATRHYD
jgi:predicted aminopeptidase